MDLIITQTQRLLVGLLLLSFFIFGAVWNFLYRLQNWRAPLWLGMLTKELFGALFPAWPILLTAL